MTQTALQKAQVKAATATAKLSSERKKKKSSKRSKKSRPSLFGWVAFLIVPIITFLGGNFAIGTPGATAPGTFRVRMARGLESLLLSYVGFNFAGQFFGKALTQGWSFIGLSWIIRKAGINRMVPRGVPVIL